MPATPSEIARRALAAHLAALPAAELLARYAATRDPEAFAGLVRQFGPMVLGACRRVLGSSADTDDAFQAVFLALARQADSFRDARALPAWLHRVALRTARKTLARRAAEPTAPATEPVDPSDPFADVAWKDVRRVLDEELDALPEKFRGPVVLCWLDGLTQAEAAGRLGVSLNTLKRRLDAGRELLRSRLPRRGLTPALVAAAVLDPAGLRADVPDALAALAVELGVGVVVPPGVQALTVVVPATTPARRYLTVGLAVVLVVGVTVAGVIAVQENQPAPAAEVPKIEPAEPARVDALGDPLPPRALLRVGTDRYRVADGWLCVLSPDATKLAIMTRTGTIRLMELGSGRTVWESAGSADWYLPPAFAPDGKRLYAIDQDHAVRVLDTDTGSTVARYVYPDPRPPAPKPDPDDVESGHDDSGYTAVWFATDPRHLFVRAGREVRVLDAATGQHVRAITTGGGAPVAIAPDGRHVYALLGARHVVQMFRDQFGDAIGQFDASGTEVRRYAIRSGAHYYFALSPDGGKLALFAAGEVRVFDTSTGAELVRERIRPPWPDNLLAGLRSFGPDGKTLLGADEDGVWEFDIASKQRVYRIQRSAGGVTDPTGYPLLSFDWAQSAWPRSSPVAGRALVQTRVLVRYPVSVAVVERWNLDSGARLPVAEGFNALRVAHSADGHVIVAADRISGRAEVLNGQTGKSVRPFRTSGHFLALSGDGGTLFTADVGPKSDKYLISDTVTGRERTVLPLGDRLLPAEDRPFALSHDGGVLVFVGQVESPPPKPGGTRTYEAGFWVYDTTTGKELWKRMSDRGDLVLGVATLSPDGRTLAHAQPNGPIVFSELRTGKELARFAPYPTGLRDGVKFDAGAWTPRFSPGGDLFGFYDPDTNRYRVLRLRGARGATELPAIEARLPDPYRWVRLSPPNVYPVPVLSFGPNGVWMATADGRDVQLWDVATGARLERLSGHRADVSQIEFAHDGRTILSCSADQTALVWEVKPKLAPGRAPDQLWADLAGEPAVAFQAVWEVAAHPGSPKFLDVRLPPAAWPDEGGLTPEHWRQKRAVLAMELAGTPETRTLLKAWASGASGAVLTEDAKASLARLGADKR